MLTLIGGLAERGESHPAIERAQTLFPDDGKGSVRGVSPHSWSDLYLKGIGSPVSRDVEWVRQGI